MHYTQILQSKNMADVVFTDDAYFKSHNLSEMPCVKYNMKLYKFDTTNIAPFKNSY